MELQEYIKTYRKEHSLSMQEFADRCGLSKGYISMLESGKHPQNKRQIVPSIDTCAKLAAGMNMTLDELLRKIDGNTTVGIAEAQKEEAPPEDDFPQVRMIARAGRRMTEEDREKMLQLIKVAFPDKFKDDG